MPRRKYYANELYRYGFNGKENDNEIKEIEGSQQDYGFRIYDPRLGKFLSVDPLTYDYPWYTPYQFAGNIPIKFIDLDGLEPANSEDKSAPKGDWYRRQNGDNVDYKYVLEKDKESTAFFDLKDWWKIPEENRNRTVQGESGQTGIVLNADGTFEIDSPNQDVGNVFGKVKWQMSLKTGGSLYIQAKDYMRSKGVGDGSFWGAAEWLAGEKAAKYAIKGTGHVVKKLLTKKSTNIVATEGTNALVETASGILIPGGKVIGQVIADNPLIRTVTKEEAECIVNRLIISGAKLTPKPNYPGMWYELPNGGGFGVRNIVSEASKKLGSSGAIDININGIPIKNIKF